MKSKFSNVWGIVLAAAFSVVMPAATFGLGDMEIPADLGASSIFGFSVAASGNLLAVSAPLNGSGSVYIFQRSGDNWIIQTKLTVNDGTAGFGGSLAMDGNTLVSNGHVFVNNNGNWILQAVLGPGNVSISRDTIAIGTTQAVYVFIRNNGAWSLQATLPLPDNSAIVTVSLQNDTLLVGEPSTGSATGMARVFARQNGIWTQQALLTAPDAAEVRFFGFGLGVSGTTIAIGAPGGGVFRDNPGSAYIYVNNNGVWSLQAEVAGDGVQEGADFGTSLALIGNTLLVGAYDDDSNGMGTAHIFIRSGSAWTEQYLLAPGINGVPGPGSFGQRFGNAVTMADSNTFIMGSPTFSTSAFWHVGAMYSSTLH